MKYLLHMGNEQAQNFTCEILVYETRISHLNINSKMKFHFLYRIGTIHA